MLRTLRNKVLHTHSATDRYIKKKKKDLSCPTVHAQCYEIRNALLQTLEAEKCPGRTGGRVRDKEEQ